MNNRSKSLTITEKEVLNYLFAYPTTNFRGRELARNLKRSVSGITNTARTLEKKKLVEVSKDFILSIQLNRENKRVFILKRINNLHVLYETELVSFLSEKFAGATIIVFGSYSQGEDTEESDIDIALLDTSEKKVNLSKFEKELGRKIQLHFFDRNISENLQENIMNGIVLDGSMRYENFR